MSDVNALKDAGNKAFAAKDYDKAIQTFTQAIALDPKNHILYSNRSAAHAGKKDWEQALHDAEEVCPDVPNGGIHTDALNLDHPNKSYLVQGFRAQRCRPSWRQKMGRCHRCLRGRPQN
ncbi:hypothetical protein SISSUDRAFT_369049 [Sistotremastrum suecicum HHB10207 ss-3]|uniref:Uncharacterized protein n=1 Tax=Sistotremastrum suecicum HHB10207 ss-3 TaxID=1314776 RepID=A0A166FXV3_9AGAM|nr:hypothetical protein SISSUDRAFT_369049 [Sistotremastrum suecicum HHB10207 ss-3]